MSVFSTFKSSICNFLFYPPKAEIQLTDAELGKLSECLCTPDVGCFYGKNAPGCRANQMVQSANRAPIVLENFKSVPRWTAVKPVQGKPLTVVRQVRNSSADIVAASKQADADAAETHRKRVESNALRRAEEEEEESRRRRSRDSGDLISMITTVAIIDSMSTHSYTPAPASIESGRGGDFGGGGAEASWASSSSDSSSSSSSSDSSSSSSDSSSSSWD